MKKIALILLIALLFTGCAETETKKKDKDKKKDTVTVLVEKCETEDTEDKEDKEDIEDKEDKEDIGNIEDEKIDVPIVKEALHYEKKIVADPYIYGGESPDLGMHVISVPEITDGSDDAKKLNEKIFGLVSEKYNQLLNNEEKHFIYGSNFVFANYKGAVGIAFEVISSAQGSGGGSSYYLFYYDSVNKKELTFEEYLSLLNVTKDTMWLRMKADNKYEYDKNDGLIEFIADSEKTYAVIDMPLSLDGIVFHTFGCLLKEESQHNEVVLGTVRDKRSLKKDVIVPNEYRDLDPKFEPHYIVVPEIVDDGDEVLIVNEALMEYFMTFYNVLNNNLEKDVIYNLTYTYTSENGVIGIMMTCEISIMYSERISQYKCFYYDSAENKVLTFKEYLDLMGVTEEKLWQDVLNGDYYKENFENFGPNAKIDSAIVDSKNSFVVVNTPEGFSSQLMVEIN